MKEWNKDVYDSLERIENDLNELMNRCVDYPDCPFDVWNALQYALYVLITIQMSDEVNKEES